MGPCSDPPPGLPHPSGGAHPLLRVPLSGGTALSRPPSTGPPTPSCLRPRLRGTAPGTQRSPQVLPWSQPSRGDGPSGEGVGEGHPAPLPLPGLNRGSRCQGPGLLHTGRSQGRGTLEHFQVDRGGQRGNSREPGRGRGLWGGQGRRAASRGFWKERAAGRKGGARGGWRERRRGSGGGGGGGEPWGPMGRGVGWELRPQGRPEEAAGVREQGLPAQQFCFINVWIPGRGSAGKSAQMDTDTEAEAVGRV